MTVSAMIWEFGFLPELIHPIQAGEWDLRPVMDLQGRKAALARDGDAFHYVYPRSMRNEPNFWKLPTSHVLSYVGQRARNKTLLEDCAEAVMRILGLIYGRTVQQKTAWVSGRVYVGDVDWLIVDGTVVTKILSEVPGWFATLPARQRRRWLNALWIHSNLVTSYSMGPEIFTWQYTVFDTCWMLLHGSKKLKRLPHAERFQEFARECRIQSDKQCFRRWVRMRNDLIHESVWGRFGPGYLGGTKMMEAELFLRKFTTTALIGLIDPLDGIASHLKWTVMGQQIVTLPTPRWKGRRRCGH
jgi:hypothetical protein